MDASKVSVKDSKTSNDIKAKIVVDTNGFIQCSNINEMGMKYDLYMTEGIIREIRDKRAREKYANLLCEIKLGHSRPASAKAVIEFCKKTGDFTTLSAVDLDVLALTHALVIEAGKGDLLRKEPPKMEDFFLKYAPATAGAQEESKPDEKEEEEEPEPEKNDDEDDDGWIVVPEKKPAGKKEQKPADLPPPPAQPKEEAPKVSEENGEKQDDNEDQDDDEDDGEGWINPDNIHGGGIQDPEKQTSIMTNVETPFEAVNKDLKVVLMTGDFAMQNVALQMGIPVISATGHVIKQAKRFVLECFSCDRICNALDKRFCPFCGNATLLKLTIALGADGKFVCFRKKNKQISTRGTIYSIPKPKTGRLTRTNNEPVVIRCEDELFMKGRQHILKQQEKFKDKEFKSLMNDFSNGLTLDDYKLKEKNYMKVQINAGRKNPNEAKRKKR